MVNVRTSAGARAGDESGAGLRSIMLLESSATVRLPDEDDALEAWMTASELPDCRVWSMVRLYSHARVNARFLWLSNT